MKRHQDTTRSWEVFISYASEDREEVAEPLATNLSGWGLRVWYDQSVLRLGDSLRRSIDKGLARSRFGVIVLSPAFFDKHWPNYELDGLAQRESDGSKVLLPLWFRVSDGDVRYYSPSLADRVAVKWEDGLASVTTEIVREVRPDLLKKAIDDVLPLAPINKAEDLIFLLRRAEAWNFGNEQPETEQEANFVADFFGFLQWWIDIGEDCDADQGARMRFMLSKKVREVHERGWRIFAAPDTRSSKTEKKEYLRVAVVALAREGATAAVQAGDAFLIHRPGNHEKPK